MTHSREKFALRPVCSLGRFFGLSECFLCLLASSNVPQQPVQAHHPAFQIVRNGDRQGGLKGCTSTRLDADRPLLHPPYLTEVDELGTKSLALSWGDKDDQGFVDQQSGRDIEESRCSTVRLLDHPCGICHQVTFRSEIEQLLVALALGLHDLLGRD